MQQGISRRGAMALMGGAALAPSLSAMAQPSGTADADALAWLRSNAQPFETHDAAPAALQPLVAALGEAQVIGLGEATGGSHEDQLFKASLVRALVMGGAGVLALDVNRRPANLLDRYVRGDGEIVEILRQPTLPQHLQTEPFLGLLGWMRAWRAAGRPAVRIIGTDVQGLGADASEAFRWLYEVNPTLARPLEQPLLPLFRDERLRDAPTLDLVRSLSPSQLDQAAAALDRLRAAILTINRGGQENAAAAALSARRSLQMGRVQLSGGAAAAQREAANRAERHRLMAENLLNQSDGARTVYWGHNLDVAGGAGPGSFLRRRLARNYRAVLFEFERGAIHAGGPGAGEPPGQPWQVLERPPVPGNLGAMLSRLEMERFWIDLGAAGAPAAWLAQPYPHDWRGGAGPVAMPLNGNADLLVFIRRLTPSRLLPFVPQH